MTRHPTPGVIAMTETQDAVQGRATGALDAVREAYGGDPADPAWRTPEGIAGIIEELSGLVRSTAAHMAFEIIGTRNLLRECSERLECEITGKTYRCVTSATPDEYCNTCDLRERVRAALNPHPEKP
jgi:hypothetical protein